MIILYPSIYNTSDTERVMGKALIYTLLCLELCLVISEDFENLRPRSLISWINTMECGSGTLAFV